MKTETRIELLKTLDYSLNYMQQSRLRRLLLHPFLTLRNSLLYRYFHIFQIRPFVMNVRAFWGKKLSLLLPIHFDFLLYGIYYSNPEIRLTKFLINYFQEGHTFFDLGANFGYYSSLIASLSPSSPVFAFEPNPDILPLLRNNAKKNITVIDKAVSDVVGQAIFYVGNLFDSGISTLNITNVDGTLMRSKLRYQIKVDTITLDSFCKQYNAYPDVVKLDVEGAEAQVLKGSKNILKKKNLVLIMEVWFNPFTKNYKNALRILRRNNFKCFNIDQDGRLLSLKYNSIHQYFKRLNIIYNSINEPSILDNLVFIKA